MENNKIIVCNHKMNLTGKEMETYLSVINTQNFSKDLVICPTNIYVPYFLKKSYSVGLQNIYYGAKGAFTGEVSPVQAKSMGITYVIVGHSERRTNFDETNDLINKKVISALDSGLKVILCIGEAMHKKKNEKIIKEEMFSCLKNVKDLANVMIAYEPLWAIGTSLTPTNDEIFKTTTFIKDFIHKEFNYEGIKVLYGGSVSDTNIEELNKITNIDGFLIGGASLNTEKLLKITKVVFTR